MSQHEGSPARLGPLELALLVAVVVAVRLFAVHTFPIYDDAFITYRYAANLAAGSGLVYNPGAPWEPVLGTTTPAYALIVAAFSWLGLAPVTASLAFNVLCDAASALLVAHLLDRRRLASGLALLCFAALPPLVRITVGGMEPPLLALLTLGSVALARADRLVPAGALAALACTVRPEAVLLVAVLALLHVRSPRQALRLLGPVAAIGAVAVLALTAVYGHPVPQSVRAKAGNHGLGLRVARSLAVLEQAFLPMRVLALALPLVALGYVRALRREAGLRPVILFALAMTAAYVAAGTKTWGWYFYMPLLAWCVTVALGLEALLERLPRLAQALQRPALTAVSALVLMAAAFSLTRRFPDRVTPEVYRPLAEWARTVRLAESGARVEASDIGAIGYFSGGLVLDSEGLVWPAARSFGGQLELIRANRPEYVLLVAERGRLLPFAGDPVFQEYRPVVRFNAKGEHDLLPDPESLPGFWTQDYIIYERRDLARR